LQSGEEEPEGGEELGGDGQRPGAKAAQAEQPRIEHRLGGAQLPARERHRGEGADC
jgi:hypothetical protein